MSKSKILTPEALRELRKERTRTVELSRSQVPSAAPPLDAGTLTSLEVPKAFPTVADMKPPAPTPAPQDAAPNCALPLSRPAATDQRNLPVSKEYSGLIRRRPRNPA